MNIEPTEEQKQAAREWQDGVEQRRSGWPTLALFLAEREAKLHKQLAFMEAGSLADYNAFAEALQKEDAYLAEIATLREVDGRKSRMLYDRDVVIDTLRARVAELEASEPNVLLQRAYSLACNERNALAERVAELEAQSVRLDQLLRDEKLRHTKAAMSLHRSSEREAAHLAHIKAMHQFLGDHEEEEGIWIPRSEFKDVPCRKYLAHYDDAKDDAPVGTEGGEG